jgi:hypothetical protein
MTFSRPSAAGFAQRLFVEVVKRGGLDAIGQDPEEQPPRQMGGRGPAQVVTPSQPKPVHVEIDEPRDQVLERSSAASIPAFFG